MKIFKKILAIGILFIPPVYILNVLDPLEKTFLLTLVTLSMLFLLVDWALNYLIEGE